MSHNASALDVQVDGDHYKKFKIQPVEYIHANEIPFIPGCIIKYASRAGSKGGPEGMRKDIEKIKHFCDLWLQLEAEAAASDYFVVDEASDVDWNRYKCSLCGHWLPSCSCDHGP